MDAESVARYLQDNPVFFEQYSDLLSHISVVHPHGDKAIPLADRQVIALRERNKALEAKLAELIQFGEENDAISEKMHRLCLALLAASSNETLLSALYFNLREDFAVPHAALRAWPSVQGDTSRPEFSPVSDATRDFAASLAHPLCGPAEHPEALSWFGEAAGQVRSVALMPLRESLGAGVPGACIGLLARGSEDPTRFYPDMGTVYLERLGELASAGLARFF